MKRYSYLPPSTYGEGMIDDPEGVYVRFEEVTPLIKALKEIRALRWPPGSAGHVADLDKFIDAVLEKFGAKP